MSLFCVYVVGALLENEAISGLSEGKPTGFRRTASSVVWTPDDVIAVVSWTYPVCSIFVFLLKKLAQVWVAACQKHTSVFADFDF